MPTKTLSPEQSFGTTVRSVVEGTKEKARKIAAVTAITLGTIGLASCANEDTPHSPETSEVVETEGVGEVEQPVPEIIQRLDKLPAEEFIQRPQAEQLTYVQYRLEERAPQYAEQYSPENDHENQHSSYTTASPSNSDNEIINNVNHVIQISQLQPDYAAGESYDGNEGKKLISGAFVVNDPKLNILNHLWAIQDINDEGNGGGRDIPVFNIVDPNNTQNEQANYDCLNDYGTTLTCRSVQVRIWNDPRQKIYHLPLVLTPFENTDGTTQYFWLTNQEVRANILR